MKLSNNETQVTAGSRLKYVARLSGFAVAMFGFGYLMVPLYDKFCEVTGLGGRTAAGPVAEYLPTKEDTSRLVTVHFDSNVNSSLPWYFEPIEKTMEVHPGRMYETMYRATNYSDQPVVAQAVPSVAPGQAALFFNKTECFCFTEQLLAAGETKDMPVRFFVHPDLPKKTNLVTLSYIIYKNEEATAQQVVALTP